MENEKGLMTKGVIWKQILWFSLPLLLGNLFQQLYNTVDSIVVAIRLLICWSAFLWAYP